MISESVVFCCDECIYCVCLIYRLWLWLIFLDLGVKVSLWTCSILSHCIFQYMYLSHTSSICVIVLSPFDAFRTIWWEAIIPPFHVMGDFLREVDDIAFQSMLNYFITHWTWAGLAIFGRWAHASWKWEVQGPIPKLVTPHGTHDQYLGHG